MQCLIWQKLSSISDADMYLFFEEGIRGGVSYISKKYSKANNEYLKSDDLNKGSKHLTYLSFSPR